MKHPIKFLIRSITARNLLYHANSLFAISLIVVSCTLFIQAFKGWSADNNDSNEQLLRQYIQSKGSDIIIFDNSNIKQFWIDHSVIKSKESFEVLLNNKESVPLKIQLANVKETQNCKIEVIANTHDFDFSVLSKNMKTISTSSQKESFLNYSIISSVIHLEDTTSLSFYLMFFSNKLQSLEIKAILLSFSKNIDSSFIETPGVLNITGSNATFISRPDFRVHPGIISNESNNKDENSFSVTGKRFVVSSDKKIIVKDNEISNSVTIKNIGKTPTNISFGYLPCTEDHQIIHNRNNPYKNKNIILTVISSEANSNKITVDAYPEWEKGCYLAFNAKEDLSDFPNFSFVDGTITDVKKIDENRSEIYLDKQLKTPLIPGEKMRVQSKHGPLFLYTNEKNLIPGEEITFSSTIKKDDLFLEYSPEALCHGTYYIVPILFSCPSDDKPDNTILITNFNVSY